MKKKYFSTLNDLKSHITSGEPSIYLGSQTSTVIPFDKLSDDMKELTFCYLEKMPKEMKLTADKKLRVTGAINWQEARLYLRSLGRDLMTTPTEELACIIAGAATSATGERCFGHGTFREQIKEVKYIDHEGVEQVLNSNKPFCFGSPDLRGKYQKSGIVFDSYKNPPFPNLVNEVDLMIGTEGQLGVITEITIDTKIFSETLFLLIPLPHWESDITTHLDIFKKVQNFRDKLLCVELLDHNSISFLDSEDNLSFEYDYIVLEVIEDELENVFEKFLVDIPEINLESVLELSSTRFQEIRAKIPRAINEYNSRNQIKKLGTDIQALGGEFEQLLKRYQEFCTLGIKYCLFGHFGDGHLHFNFLPRDEEIEKARDAFENLYRELSVHKISPFAEHGIGIIKQDYIRSYYSEDQVNFFMSLKREHDPKNQFFPLGFMSISL